MDVHQFESFSQCLLLILWASMQLQLEKVFAIAFLRSIGITTARRSSVELSTDENINLAQEASVK